MSDTVADKQPTPGQGSPRRRALLLLRDVVFVLLAALILSFLIKTFVIRSFYIPSGSMENTLTLNDHVITSLLSPSVIPLQRGDVVVFKDPGGWLDGGPTVATPPSSTMTDVLAFVGLAAPTDNDHLIKRVIGLPGDHVACCSATGKVTVNGAPITEPYIVVPAGATASDPNTFSVTVPQGDIWVMGDNRYQSADSAYNEVKNKAVTPFVPLKDVTGQAFMINWPFSRFTFLGNYPAVFAHVPEAK
jgi:signal peptidase I